MRDKNNWKHKNNLKQEKIFKKMMDETVLKKLVKPINDAKHGASKGTQK